MSGGNHQGNRAVIIGKVVKYFERDREVNRESTKQRVKFYVGKRKERKNNGEREESDFQKHSILNPYHCQSSHCVYFKGPRGSKQ